MLSLTLLPAYKRLFSSSGLSVQPSSVDSTQIELGILDIRLPPSPAMLSTPCPGSLGQVAGICLFSSLQLPHCTFSSTRMTFFPSGDHMITPGLRDLDSTAAGKWSFLPRSTSTPHNNAGGKRESYRRNQSSSQVASPQAEVYTNI